MKNFSYVLSQSGWDTRKSRKGAQDVGGGRNEKKRVHEENHDTNVDPKLC
jgi:hypothetical protein